MKTLFSLAFLLLAISLSNATYSKYGRTCADIGCSTNEECVMQEDACSRSSKKDCGTYPTCKRVSTKASTCATYICPPTQTCQMKKNKPHCVDSANSVPNRHKRQSYNPSFTGGDTTPNSPIYPQLRQTTPSAPIDRSQTRKQTTERPSAPNTYRIGYTQQPQNSYPTQPGSAGRGYPNQGYQNQGYPNQGYPNQGYPNQGYPNQGYPNQGYPNQGYPNQGYPNQGYPNQGYPNQGYPNQGYPNQGYPNQRFPNQGYPNQGYSNQGYYPNQGYNPGYQNPPYQQGYNPQGVSPNRQNQNQGVFDPIIHSITRTVSQIGANYIKDKIFNPSGNNKNKPQTV